MDWKNRLTKTPYLVLFIILISVGVGTASAMITITLAGNVHITGDASVDGDLSVGTNDASDDDSILFDDGTKVLRWDDSIDRFEISDDLALPGVIEAGIDTEGVAQFQTPYHRFGFATTSHGLVDANDVVVNGEFEVNGNSFFDGDLNVGLTTIDSISGNVGINEATPQVGLHNRGKSILLDETTDGSGDFPALWFKTKTVSSGSHHMFMKGNEGGIDEAVTMYHQNIFPTDLPTESGAAQTFWWHGGMSIGSYADTSPAFGGMIIPDSLGVGTTTPDAKLEVVGEILATPIVGQWSNDFTTVDLATDFVEFDRERFPSDATYFGFTAGDDFIQIKKAGLYRITAKVLFSNGVAGDFGLADVWRYNSANVQLERICRIATTMAGSLADTECSAIHPFDANDRVKLEDDTSSTSIFGSSAGFNTFLNIERLN